MTSNYTKALGYAYIALYFHPLLTLKAPTDAIFLLKDDIRQSVGIYEYLSISTQFVNQHLVDDKVSQISRLCRTNEITVHPYSDWNKSKTLLVCIILFLLLRTKSLAAKPLRWSSSLPSENASVIAFSIPSGVSLSITPQ